MKIDKFDMSIPEKVKNKFFQLKFKLEEQLGNQEWEKAKDIITEIQELTNEIKKGEYRFSYRLKKGDKKVKMSEWMTELELKAEIKAIASSEMEIIRIEQISSVTEKFIETEEI